MSVIEKSPERHHVIRGHLRRVLLRRFPLRGLLQGFSIDDQCCGGDSWAPTPGGLVAAC